MFDDERAVQPPADPLRPGADDDLEPGADDDLGPGADDNHGPGVDNEPADLANRQPVHHSRAIPIDGVWVRRHAAAATVAVVATTLVAGLLAWNVARPDDRSTADASHPATSGTAAASAGPTASNAAEPPASIGPDATYEPLTDVATTPTAVLTARGALGAVVPLDASFRLESADGSAASALAANLTVEPSFTFSVKPETGDRAALLTPARPLAPGIVYRFALRGGSGELLDTWAFQARQPLRIVGTLPEAKSAEVPLDTGIEVTFDQDGVTGADAHFSIQPATNGRFEQHDRTLAFVPDRPLASATVYIVTVSRGVTVTATGEATNVDTRFQFETQAKAGANQDPLTFQFPEVVSESSTAERATIELWSYGGDSSKPPATTKIAVYRLAGIAAAIDAFRTIRALPDWTRFSDTGQVDVTGLTRVLSADLPLTPYRNGSFFRLPARLPAGWYLVQQSGGPKPIQEVLQVTNVAGYLAISTTKTIVWANDLRTGAPIGGATVSSEGASFGRTDTHGLALGATPATLLPTVGATCSHPCDPVVVVRTGDGRSIFLPAANGQDKLDSGGGVYWWSAADPQTWSLLHTDRTRFRPGDTVNLWGYARDRDSGAAPTSVTVRLYAQSADGGDTSAPAVATLDRKPDANGAFKGSIPLTGMPDGYYTLSLSIGSRVIQTTTLVIGPIAKPAYQLDVTTGRRIYIVGDHVTVTVTARFFEGTPVPGVPLTIDGFGGGSATTDTLGTAVWRTIATINPDQDLEGPIATSIGAIPARAEEADITSSSHDLVVFPSSRTIDAAGRFANGRVVARGGVHVVAVNRLEAAVEGGASIWDLDARGAAVRGATVTVRFIELIPVRTQTGTEYDFVEKKVVPVYRTDVRERAAGTVHVRTASDGSWTASVPASVSNHEYRIVATVGDPDGHTAQASTSASRTVSSPYENGTRVSLDPTSSTANRDGQFGIGERIDLTMTDLQRHQASGDGTRYLFFTTQRGIRAATVQSSRRFISSFPSWGAPNLSIGAVRFTGAGYVGTAWFAADFHFTDRRLQVDLTTDAARYVPGGTVNVAVRTRTAGGAPVSATVILRAVDEKLFTIGAAQQEDPLTELYLPIGDGVVGTYRSHRDPQGQPEGGDTTGGGGDDRDDFRDSLLFTAITTDASGRGTTSFRLSDDLTSWRVTAAAVTRRLQAGVGSVLVPVGLPFFVDASVAPEYLTADRPTIAVRTFGGAVTAGTPVTVRVTSPSLGFDSGVLHGSAFATIDIPLPALRSGTQTLTITATTGTGSAARTDRLTRTFSVVDTRLTRQRTNYVELPASGPFGGGSGFTTVEISDASGGRYLSLLTDLAAGGGARLDRALAADLARALLKDRFGSDGGLPAGEPFAADRYQALDHGLAIVPYGSSDLELSALVAIVAPDKVDRAGLAAYLRTIRENPDETRERRLFGLAGLAGLGESVLPAIRTAASDPDLTVREQLMLGLGAASLGDTPTARTILAAVATAVGQQSGSLARLRVGTTAADITAGTALAAALAAAVGNPLAGRFWAYVAANPAVDRIEVLPAIAFATHMLDRLPVSPARLAWTIAGTRHVVDLGRGESIQLVLTPTQLASLTIDRLAGSIGVTTEWREAVAPSAFAPDPDLTITRSVQPAGPIHAADLVVVDLNVSFGAQAASGCRQVTELVPSGLAPVGAESRWYDPDNEDVPPDDGVVLPYDQSGPRVFFCVEPTSTRRTFTLRYVARVVTPGTYVWEPAVAQSVGGEAIANLTAATTLTIQ
jgi:hypothetical protein